MLPIAPTGIGLTQPPAAPSSAVAATVNGESITLAELDVALGASIPTVPLTVSQRRQLRTSLLNELIDDRLLKQFLAKSGTKVDPAEIEAQMTLLTVKLRKENRTLAAYLKETGQTEAQLRADWTAAVQLSNHVKQQATDEQLKAYFAANRDHFDKVEVRVSHIMIRINKSSPQVEQVAAREKLEAIRADLLEGHTDFAAAARRFSQCPSARSGGDVGFTRRRGLPEDEPLARAAFALKVGEVSGVVQTEFGLHLLTVTERKPGSPTTIEKCTVEVLEAYTDDYRIELVAKLRKEAQIRITLP
jgi:peptidyl-prolyl cis-trans isomerase C